jgi:transcriptional regulator with XRE-family HTH domain
LAERLGTEQSIVSKYECGDLRLDGELIVKLAAALRVSTDELLGHQGKESTIRPAVKDRRLWRRITAIDKLSKRDREALVWTIELSSPRPSRVARGLARSQRRRGVQRCGSAATLEILETAP